ncbi:hypothetical protein VOLCADRAFT_115825 [Volvox carteri f. nagariensis]|uniref:Fe2OG dioxygenase domain-containing protein n=1 Tax=Volvox carteri f. nagariensis TaxID=3068 RepID=D8TIJ4_VOLCA|nr:uncharacterized protein VOLCADRAFT_115825 [Volvox carteri f. nagariensis]EFJ53252.1 hypothetical protein VOLCADRAFT_115825 [Volvox carteri f. nagariensis]|eukprot:XP_002946257.1 hypothetical protein VOLCADRAFT_115825 [Volvox carteri f. nagariensis]
MQYGGADGEDDGALLRTAYREAEKKYQLFRERKVKMKHGKPKPGKLVIRPIDTSDVLDLHLGPKAPLPPEVFRHHVPNYDGPVYTFERHPALPAPQQFELIAAALMDYPEPPAHTNHDLQYGPLTGLWRAARQGLRLNWGRKDDPHGGPPASTLLHKLRWATLGPQFDWTQRQYDFESVYRRLPPSLEALAKQLAAVVDGLEGAGLRVLPAAAACGGYRPDAAIVNYYQQGDVLGGHLDDVERDMAQPIVSVSLGCPAIFLMGGRTKHVAPSALLLRGGDVLVLAGDARTCYHGVPRILEANYPRVNVGGCGGDDGDGGGCCNGSGGFRAQEGCWDGQGGTFDGVDFIQGYIRSARINISIRAVT